MKLKPIFPIGTVLQLRAGLNYANLTDNSVQVVRDSLTVIVEGSHYAKPGSEDDHYELSYLVEFRFLGADGSYDPAAPVGMFALSGDFRPDFIDAAPKVLGARQKTFKNPS